MATDNEVNVLDQLTESLQNLDDAILNNDKRSMRAEKKALKQTKKSIEKSGILGEQDKKKYSKQIEKALKQNKANTSVAMRAVKASGSLLRDVLPTSDMLMGAIATQNPMAAFSMNVLKGIISATKKDKDSDLKSKRKMNKAEKVSPKPKRDTERPKVKPEPSPDINIDPSMIQVELTSKNLPDIQVNPDLQSVKESISPIEQALNDHGMTLELHTDLLDGIHSALDDTYKLNKDLARKAERVNLQNLERQEEAQQNVQREPTPVIPLIESEATNVVDRVKSVIGSMGTAATVMAGGLSGLILPKLMEFTKRIKGVLGFVGKFTNKTGSLLMKAGPLVKGLGRLAGPIGLVTSAVFAVKDFFSGFTDPEKILGEGANTFSDRVAAGSGALLGGIVGIIDGAASLLGFDTNLQETVQKKVAQFHKSIYDTIKRISDMVVKFVQDKADDLLGMFNLKDKVSGTINNLAKLIGVDQPSPKPVVTPPDQEKPDTTGKSITGVSPVLLSRMKAMELNYEQWTGKDLKYVVNSAVRSFEEQNRLFQQSLLGGPPANRPGTSKHETGDAIDISSRQLNKLDTMGLLKEHGLVRPYKNEPWHMEVDPKFRSITQQTLTTIKSHQEQILSQIKLERTKKERDKMTIMTNTTNQRVNNTTLVSSHIRTHNPDGSLRYIN